MASYWPKFSPLTRKWFYTLIFTSNHFQKKREREKREPRSESTDRRSRHSSIDERCDHLMNALVDRAARRSLPLVAVDRNWRRDHIAHRSMSGAIGEITIDGGDDWRATAAKIEIAQSSPSSGFVFSFFFSKHQKIFFRKFFEMQRNTWKHFPSWKIEFLENGIFSRNAFTRTKHSLNGVLYEEKRVLLKHSWSYSAENQRKLMKKRKKETEWIES